MFSALPAQPPNDGIDDIAAPVVIMPPDALEQFRPGHGLSGPALEHRNDAEFQWRQRDPAAVDDQFSRGLVQQLILRDAEFGGNQVDDPAVYRARAEVEHGRMVVQVTQVSAAIVQHREAQLRRYRAIGSDVPQRQVDTSQRRPQFEIGALDVDPGSRLLRAGCFAGFAAEPAPQEQ